MRSVLLGLLCMACGAPQYAQEDARYAQAERAFSTGHTGEARHLFTEIARSTDPDTQALALYRIARLDEAVGDLDHAQAGYQRVIATGHIERAPLAQFRLALLAKDPLAALTAVVDEHPDSAAADKVVRYLPRHFEPVVAEAHLAEWSTRHRAHTVADNAAFARAHLQVFQMGDFAAARLTLRSLVQTWPESALVDDALWLLAAIYCRQGAWAHAFTTYSTLADYKDETSLLVGSYRSTRSDDAALRAGMVALNGLKDPAKAATAYRQLLDRYESSVLRDDAWLGLAQAAMGQNDLVGAKKAAKSLLDEQPDSRWANQARQLIAGQPWTPDFHRIPQPLLDPSAETLP